MFSADEYGALTRGAGLIARTDRGRLRLAGTDRGAYLQGILTNDIAALGPGQGCYAAMLTPNGRMVADMRVLELGDSLLLDLDARLTQSIQGRLDQFIFAEDVTVADETASLSQLGVYGPEAARIVAETLRGLAGGAGGGLPDAGRLDALRLNHSIRAETGAPAVVAASDDFGARGFELFVDAGSTQRFSEALVQAGAARVSRETAEIARVEAGRPLFGVDMDEDTIPLEAGIEDRAISLTKGCYVGQEIIIRVLHRGGGRVARRLVGLAIDGPVPARGDRISAGGRETGTITSAVKSPALGRAIAMGYVRRDHAEPGTAVTVASRGGRIPASVVTLPFVTSDRSPATS